MEYTPLNIEQMEAEEIATTPRIVITADKFFLFNREGRTLTFNIKNVRSMLGLQQSLEKSVSD